MTTKEIIGRIDDVPDHEAANTSSVGRVGEPKPASFGRLKGFYVGGVINHKEGYDAAMREFQKGREKLGWIEQDASPTRVAASQGRTFSTDTCADYGYPDKGILIQQVPISGSPRETAYNDLIVTSLTRKDLYERFV